MQRAGLHAGRVEGAANGPLTRSPPETDALSGRAAWLPCGERKCAITRGCAEPPLGAVTVVVAFEMRRIGRTANLRSPSTPRGLLDHRVLVPGRCSRNWQLGCRSRRRCYRDRSEPRNKPRCQRNRSNHHSAVDPCPHCIVKRGTRLDRDRGRALVVPLRRRGSHPGSNIRRLVSHTSPNRSEQCGVRDQHRYRPPIDPSAPEPHRCAPRRPHRQARPFLQLHLPQPCQRRQLRPKRCHPNHQDRLRRLPLPPIPPTPLPPIPPTPPAAPPLPALPPPSATPLEPPALIVPAVPGLPALPPAPTLPPPAPLASTVGSMLPASPVVDEFPAVLFEPDAPPTVVAMLPPEPAVSPKRSLGGVEAQACTIAPTNPTAATTEPTHMHSSSTRNPLATISVWIETRSDHRENTQIQGAKCTHGERQLRSKCRAQKYI